MHILSITKAGYYHRKLKWEAWTLINTNVFNILRKIIIFRGRPHTAGHFPIGNVTSFRFGRGPRGRGKLVSPPRRRDLLEN